MRVILIIIFSIIAHFSNAQSAKKVLIIGIDGCRADALVAAHTPNIDQLLNNAVYSLHAQNDDITVSGPGWSAMLTGVWSDKHGVVNNGFGGNNLAAYPHFFNRLKSINPSFNCVSISQWAPINNIIVNTNADYKVNAADGVSVTMEAIDRLSNHNPDAIFLQYDDADHVGHSSGFSVNNPAYLNQISRIDYEIGFVLNALYARPTYANEDWLILLSTDHGGINTSHGGTSIEEETIFTIAHNKSFSKRQIFPDTVLIQNCVQQDEYLHLNEGPDMVNIPHIPAYNFGASGDFTVECRVKTSSAADVAIIGNKNWGSGVNRGFVLSFKLPNGPEWKVNIGDETNRRDINTGAAIADGDWHHIAATFDRDGNMTIYNDGVMSGSISMANIGNIDNGFPIRIGADVNGNFQFNGSIQEVRLWNKVLNQSTINNWKCNQAYADHPDFNHLIGYWPLNEGIGSNAGDMSFNNNHGSITSATWQNSDIQLQYTNTPRITDIALSALDWMCVDIVSEWALDGKSLMYVNPGVNSLTDNTAGCLRAMILSSCPNDTIVFATETDNFFQLVNQGEIHIPHNITIKGNGINHTYLSGDLLNRIFIIPEGITMNIENLTLTKGYSETSGGAFLNFGTINLNNVILIDNMESSTKKSFTNSGLINVINVVESKD
ncbi:MAG: alkaline phosphatase family protein [Saprospiraceae bacterium]|nr:alkaline phosphatase family protein [Saprospiraceae bacterium]